MHGDFLGYRLSFRPRDVDETKATVVPIEDPSLTVRRDEGKQRCLREGEGGEETKVRPQSPCCLFMHTSVTPSLFCIDGQAELQCIAVPVGQGAPCESENPYIDMLTRSTTTRFRR